MLLLLCGWCAGQGGISPHFEVASLKPAGDAPARQCFSGGPGSGDPERALWVKVSPQGLIEAAYLVEPYQISGPAWLRTDRYSVTVKIPPGSTRRKFRQMIANLLAERFSLVFHRVTRPLAAYEFALAPGRQLKLSPSPEKEGGAPQFRGTRTDQGLTHYTFTQTSMEPLADDLRLMIPRRTPGAPLDLRPVMDRTGIASISSWMSRRRTRPRIISARYRKRLPGCREAEPRQGGSRSTGDRPRGTHAHGPLGRG